MLLKLGYQLVNPILKPSLKVQPTTTAKSLEDTKLTETAEKSSEKKVKFLDVTTISDAGNLLQANSNTEKSGEYLYMFT
jgi:hypothetical protein